MIISDALAELWPGEDTRGRRIQFVDLIDGKRSLENPSTWVVGIMPSVTSSFSKNAGIDACLPTAVRSRNPVH